MASIAMRAVMSAASELASEDPPFAHQHIQQFVTAALFGNSVNSFEVMLALSIPVVIDPNLANLPDSASGKWADDLRLDVVGKRVEKAVGRICVKEGKPMPDPDSIPSQFQKLRVGNIVATQIRRHGLCLYTHKLLFSPEFEKIGMAVLKEMKQPDEQRGEEKFTFARSTASAAIANGLLPALPARNLKGFSAVLIYNCATSTRDPGHSKHVGYCISRNSRTIQEPLSFNTSVLDEELSMCVAFDTLLDNIELQCVSNYDDR